MSQPRFTHTSTKHHKIFSSSIISISIFDAFNIHPRNQGAVLKLDQFHITKGNPQQLSVNIHRGEIIHDLEEKKHRWEGCNMSFALATRAPCTQTCQSLPLWHCTKGQLQFGDHLCSAASAWEVLFSYGLVWFFIMHTTLGRFAIISRYRHWCATGENKLATYKFETWT